jgi:hypothetical protein
MDCSAQEIVDAIITAGAKRGSDGRGKDGLDGHMSMLARTDRRKFGILLGRALRLKMKAKPDGRETKGKKYLTEEEAKAELRASGISVEILQFCHRYDLRNLPAEPPESAGPNNTRNLMEAVVNAAIRHGNDGHGKDGFVGYRFLLQRTEPTIFNMLMGVAQRWQASRSDKPNKRKPLQTEEEIFAEMRANGTDIDGYLQWRSRRDAGCSVDYDPYPEIDDEGLVDVIPKKENY